MQNAQERAQKIKAILTDVDGILTDGKVNFFVAPDGKIEEIKSFNTQDGIAVMLCRSAGIICGIITGRRHPTTVERARNLGFKYMYQGFLTKLGPLEDIFVEYLRDFCKRGEKTVFLTSHIIQDLERLVDDCIIMDYGKILKQCPVSELITPEKTLEDTFIDLTGKY